MGGRIASSGMGSGSRKPEYDESIMAIIGPKGEIPTWEQALKAANPNYNMFNPRYSRNCQRCVFAYEMLMRGYAVEARERILDGSDTLPNRDSIFGWPKVMKGGHLLKGVPSLKKSPYRFRRQKAHLRYDGRLRRGRESHSKC